MSNYFNSDYYYKPEQDEVIKKFWQTKTDAEIGKLIGKTKHGIKERRRKLGLINFRQPKKWTEKDISFLKENYLTKTDAEVAIELGKPNRYRVREKRLELGLKVGRGVRKDVKTKKEKYIDNYGEKNIEEALKKDNYKDALEILECKKMTFYRIKKEFTKTKEYRKYEADEIDFVVRNYKLRANHTDELVDNTWIARKLNLTMNELKSLVTNNRSKIMEHERQKEEHEEELISQERLCPRHHVYTFNGVCINCEAEK